jgi:hypothetical protein
MSWERDPLWAKCRLFITRALEVPREDPVFGLWCSLGLELLARAALSSVSPALLAKPDPNHKNLLHILHKGSEIPQPRSIDVALAFQLCHQIFQGFTNEDLKLSLALLNRRNEELHSGAAAFDEYSPSQWLVGFYHACQSLTSVLGETLSDLFGEDEASFAEHLLTEDRENLQTRVLNAIAEHTRLFSAKGPDEQSAARAQADASVRELSGKRHHRVVCPACGSAAGLQGTPFGKEHVTHEENGEIAVRQGVSPTEFSCSACGLHLTTYAALETAGLADPYTRTTTSSPEDYYGLISPDDLDSYLEEYVRNQQEYDNE